MSGDQPRAHGAAALVADMRRSADDFRVTELDGFVASGSGEHLLLVVEKRGMTTAYAAQRLAQWAGVPELAIGYAGMKDRHAVTRQRFSVHLPRRQAPDLAGLERDDLRVLGSTWHARKLPRGALAGNAFTLVLRDVVGTRATIEARLEAIAAHGVPNYFGEQRFGREGDNVANALAMFAGRRVRREQRTHLLSAARSQLFNQVLAARVAAGSWDQAREGEVWLLDGSRSVFGPEPWSEVLADRLACFDIHPSGPLWGRGALRSADAVHAIEAAAVADPRALALRSGLEAAGLAQERRSLRLPVRELRWSWPGEGALQLDFTLQPGAYATSVLAELGDVRDASRVPDRSSELPSSGGKDPAAEV